jgi:hypothetical protein
MHPSVCRHGPDPNVILFISTIPWRRIGEMEVNVQRILTLVFSFKLVRI